MRNVQPLVILFIFLFSGDDLYITVIFRYNMAGSLFRLSTILFYVLYKKYFKLPTLFIVS